MKFVSTFIILLIGFYGHSQNYQKDSAISDYSDYISGITTSNDGLLIGFSIGSEATFILDSAFNEVVKFNHNPLWGGGGAVFSNDGQYVAYKLYGEFDTIVTYNLLTKEFRYLQTNVSGIRFLNKSNILIISWNGYFRLYDLESEVLSNEILRVGEKQEEFFSSYTLDSNDNNLYVTTANNKIEVFSIANWKLEKSYGPFEGEISNLTFCGKYLVYNIGNTIFRLNLNNGTYLKTELQEIKYISIIIFDSKTDDILVAGNGANIYKYNLENMKKSVVISDLSNKSCYGMMFFMNTHLLIGNYNQLLFKKFK